MHPDTDNRFRRPIDEAAPLIGKNHRTWTEVIRTYIDLHPASGLEAVEKSPVRGDHLQGGRGILTMDANCRISGAVWRVDTGRKALNPMTARGIIPL
jgi:hypothetical protein